jgi:3-oxoacyl-[acyl-carrier protein] reductase
MSQDIAVVTGASGGIGRAVAKLLSEKSGGDLRIGIHYRENVTAAEALRLEIENSFLIKANLAVASGRSALLEATLKEGTPYILVNNAGIDRPHESALSIQESSLDLILNVNLKTPILLMRDFANEMLKSGSGVIVNVSSVLARKTLIGSAAYRASKAALEAVTRQFAMELGPKGVRVNAVSPGFIETAMTEAIPDEIRGNIRREIALGQFGTPEAVALAVGQLVENDYLNGVVLHVDGGMSL